MFTVGIITASDKGFRGERTDESGPLIQAIVESAGYEVVEMIILPDDRTMLRDKMVEMSDRTKINLILTTGGTGFSKRDITPEATLDVVERLAPGIPEAMRYASLQITPKGCLSRATAGIRGDSMIINLPGSPKAVKENLEAILPALRHGLEILTGSASECGANV